MKHFNLIYGVMIVLAIVIVFMVIDLNAKCKERKGVLVQTAMGWVECVPRYIVK